MNPKLAAELFRRGQELLFSGRLNGNAGIQIATSYSYPWLNGKKSEAERTVSSVQRIAMTPKGPVVQWDGFPSEMMEAERAKYHEMLPSFERAGEQLDSAGQRILLGVKELINASTKDLKSGAEIQIFGIFRVQKDPNGKIFVHLASLPERAQAYAILKQHQIALTEASLAAGVSNLPFVNCYTVHQVSTGKQPWWVSLNPATLLEMHKYTMRNTKPSIHP